MTGEPLKVLLVDPDSVQGGRLASLFANPGPFPVQFKALTSLSESLKVLAAGAGDIVLLSLALPDCEGCKGIQQLVALDPAPAVVALVESDDEGQDSLNQGAFDYLIRTEMAPSCVYRAIRHARERWESRVALLRVEQKYRSIFENTVEGIFQTSPNGRYLSANSSLARIYGYENPEELVAMLTDIGGQLYVETGRRDEFVKMVQANNVVTNFESRIQRKDGTVIWISENVRAVRDKDGRLLFYEGTVEDITERKAAEERVRDSENLYHSLVENLPQSILRKDLSERFTFANQGFCSMLGRTLDEIIGKTDFDFFPAELAAKYQRDDRGILETGRIFETIEEHQPPHGEKIYVNVVKTPLYDSEGRIVGLQGIFWDITEKKRAEESLKAAHAQLEQNREELRVKNVQMEEDLRMAREIQQAIIPQQYPVFFDPAHPGQAALSFCHRYLPTGVVGGDFFNVVALSESKAGIFICDVMGHGVRSALITAIVRALVEETTSVAADPGQLMSQINRDLRAILKQSGAGMYTTGVYLVVDLERGEIAYANAGHPKPLLLHRGTGEVETLANCDQKSRPALGLADNPKFVTTRRPFAAGDVLVLFTDGIFDVEGQHADRYTPQWFKEEIQARAKQPMPAAFDDIVNEVRGATEGDELTDDVCLLAVEWTPSRSSGETS